MQSVIYLLFWALLFFLMMRLGCGAHMMGHSHHRRHHDEDNGRPTPAEARDPVCGMTVAKADAELSVLRGRPYYFCSSECRETFDAAPETFARRSTITETLGGQHGTA